MVDICPVLLVLHSAVIGEGLLTHVQGILYQHSITTCILGVKNLLNTPPDCVGCGDMTGLLQDHRLKDDEPLRVPQSVPHPVQLFHQGHHKASPDLPTWRVVAQGGNYREVTPPPLPNLIVPDTSIKVNARVGTNLFP